MTDVATIVIEIGPDDFDSEIEITIEPPKPAPSLPTNPATSEGDGA